MFKIILEWLKKLIPDVDDPADEPLTTEQIVSLTADEMSESEHP
jgi:hypothetical protein